MRSICSIAIVWIACGSALGQDAGEKVLRAGASMVDVTPELGSKIVGGWGSPPATKVHDPLHVRCLVLDDGAKRIGFVICDSVGVPKEVFDAARTYIGLSKQIDPSHLLMSATHTHSGTSSRETVWVNGVPTLSDYQQRLARGIGDAVKLAIERLQPAQIGWGSVEEPTEVFNRRWFVSDPKLRTNPFGGVDQVRMNPPRQHRALVKQAGPIDPQVSFISVRSSDDKPMALLANYSLHYVGGVPTGEISADYFAVFANKIGEKLNADAEFVGIMTNGTSGDVNNIDFSGESVSVEPYEKMTLVAEKVAAKVAAAESSLEFRNSVSLRVQSGSLTFDVRKPGQAMTEYFKKVEQSTGERPVYHRHEDTYAKRVADLAKQPDQVTIDVQAFGIDDLGIVSSPFETFAETGLEIKRRSPMADTFVIELANGSEGYLPTPRQHDLGGYETWMGTSRVQKDASTQLTDTLVRLLESIQ